MRIPKSFQPLFVFVLFFGLLTACNDDDDERISPIQETIIEGDASSLQIDMTRSNWRIASVTSLDGFVIADEHNTPLQLEGLGSLQHSYFVVKRDKENALTIELQENFDKEERGFIINLEINTGFYKEQIIVRQKQCTSFYKLESITYSMEEGDGVEEAESQPWGMNVYDHTNNNGETVKTTFWPFYNAYIIYSFHTEKESPFKWIDPEEGIYVDMPKHISNGEIIYETEKRKYGSWLTTYDSELKERTVEVDQVNQKKNIYSADIYYKQLQLSYIMTLSREGNDVKKVFKGKLVKKYPYDCSPIQHRVEDLGED